MGEQIGKSMDGSSVGAFQGWKEGTDLGKGGSFFFEILTDVLVYPIQHFHTFFLHFPILSELFIYFPIFVLLCIALSKLFPTCSWNCLELSPTFSYFLSTFLDFIYPPYLLQPSPTESRRRSEKVEKVEKVGEDAGTSRRQIVKILGHL